MVLVLSADVIGGRAFVEASKVLHQKLLFNILRLSIKFFDTNTTGRILSRFSKDIDDADNKIPEMAFDFIYCFWDVSYQDVY